MNNREKLHKQIVMFINSNEKYSDRLPTEDEIYSDADMIRDAFKAIYPVSEEEYINIKNRLPKEILHSIGYAATLVSRDGKHQPGWYLRQKNDGYFWNRYKQYLAQRRNSENVNRLNTTTNGIMDNLGDPHSDEPFQRRGLLMGDVQSGKTATYIGVCNKAADAGYKVIIVLAGMMENLRVQTQERLDSDFVGLDSKYILDKNADISLKNIPVGVGKINPDPNHRITRFTSVTCDFKTQVLRSNGLNLSDLQGTSLFVVKKNKSILNNLHKWLTKDDDILNLPLLLIDDEADNASVNTNPGDSNPTAINKAINKILRSFRQATYMGITATPFANIFIDETISEDGAAKDLFPKDFLTLLPTPDEYIGVDKIFGQGVDDDWENRKPGEYEDAIVPIMNEEQKDFYIFKHKKELADDLFDIPYSLKEAVRYFVLVTAVTDYKMDEDEHRSMMVNVSRFTRVQNRTRDLIESYLVQLQSDIENYSELAIDDALKIKGIQLLKETWDKYSLERKSHTTWENICHNYLHPAARRIVVRAVNRTTGTASLDYYKYKGRGMRVIAVGGNGLARGLTLEGLIVSYFYRNTMMYDTLLQMGRWFGYRVNYENLFKIWMGQDAVDWYGYITDAVNELKTELRQMAAQNETPEHFGLKVRQTPGFLIVTARNKMRNGTPVSVPITVSSRMIETPRLWNVKEKIEQNNELAIEFLKKINDIADCSYDSTVHAHIWHGIPGSLVASLASEYECHPWNLNFQSKSIEQYINSNDDILGSWDVAIPDGKHVEPLRLSNVSDDLEIIPEDRKFSASEGINYMIRVNGTHVRIGAGGCAKIGLSEAQIEKVKAIAKKEHRNPSDKDYLKTFPDRAPIALIHFMYKKNDDLPNLPNIIVGLGFGFPGNGEERNATYVVNAKALEDYIDTSEMTEDENDIS